MPVDPPSLTNTSAPPAVAVHDLSFRYRSLDDDGKERSTTNSLAITDISFTLPAGELMLIAGPSGCGKSTLLKCLNGLIPRSYKGMLRGDIQLEGRSIKGLS